MRGDGGVGGRGLRGRSSSVVRRRGGMGWGEEGRGVRGWEWCEMRGGGVGSGGGWGGWDTLMISSSPKE